MLIAASNPWLCGQQRPEHTVLFLPLLGRCEMVDRFTEGARRSIASATIEARRHGVVRSDHLLFVVLRDGALGARILRLMGVDLARLASQIQQDWTASPDVAVAGEMAFSADMKQALALALEAATELGYRHVRIEHLLLGIVKTGESRAAELLRHFGVSADSLREAITEQSVGGVKQFQGGDRVRILEGPFKNFPGVVEQFVAEEGRVRVAVPVFGRVTPVDLRWYEVEHSQAS